MRFTKTKKTIMCLAFVFVIILILFGSRCKSCKMLNSVFAAYCNYCSEPLLKEKTTEHVEVPHEEAILGQWKTLFEYYYEYEFFADGTCKGYYCGRNPDYEPCLHPEWYIVGSGDGEWYFEGDELVVVYTGENKNATAGTHRYKYEFNEDYTKLKIFGLDNDVVWLKVPKEA